MVANVYRVESMGVGSGLADLTAKNEPAKLPRKLLPKKRKKRKRDREAEHCGGAKTRSIVGQHVDENYLCLHPAAPFMTLAGACML